MLSLRKCTDDVIRDAIFADMQYIKAAIQDLERQIVIEKDKCFLVTEEQIVNRLTKLATGDIHNLVYRRSLIRIFVNKILIYDDKIILTFKTGDEDVVIPDILLNQLEEGLGSETLCLSEQSGHQTSRHPVRGVCFFVSAEIRIIKSNSPGASWRRRLDGAEPLSVLRRGTDANESPAGHH